MGQADASARFVAPLGRGNVLLMRDGFALYSPADQGKAVRVHLLNANPSGPIPESPTGGYANYYLSNNPAKWLSHIPLYSRVRYKQIYPGIDAVFYGSLEQLEYDLEVAPGANPATLRFAFSSADHLSIESNGSLKIATGGQNWFFLAPVAYQFHGSKKSPVQVSYQLSPHGLVSFRLGAYDPTQALVIDPVVTVASYLPGTDLTSITATETDSAGNLFILGTAKYQVSIVELNQSSSAIVFYTHIGTLNANVNSSTPTALALDQNDSVFATGFTNDAGFPFTADLTTCGTSCIVAEGFVTKLDSSGALSYSVRVGESPRSITVDSSGDAYVAGDGVDNSLQTVNAFQSSPGPFCTSCDEAFFAKLNSSGTAFLYSSYFSGTSQPSGEIQAQSIALDPSGNVLIAGNTNEDPPLVNPWQSGIGGLFFAKFAPDGKTLLLSTRFGSSQNLSETAPAGDVLSGMKVGQDGTVYLVGYTQSQDFPYSANSPAHQLEAGGYGVGTSYMFAVAIDRSLTKLTYSDYLGEGFPTAMAIDSTGNLFVSGEAVLDLLPLANAVVSDISTGGFYLELDPSGKPVAVSDFGGHVSSFIPTTIASGPGGSIYLVGNGDSSFGSLLPVNYFNFPAAPDPIQAGTGVGANSGVPFAIVGMANRPQLSLSTLGPFLTLRNAGSADLHITGISLGGGLVKQSGNCSNTVPGGKSCVLTVSDANGLTAAGTVTISSDAQLSSQTFSITVASSGRPIGDQLWSQDIRFYYPPQLEGTSTAPIPMTVWNVGVGNATIDSITAVGGLSETDSCSTQAEGGSGILAPGSNCVVQVSLTPSSSQPQLHFVYDSSRREDLDAVFFDTPNGQLLTNQLLLSASAIDFGTQQVGGVAIPRIVTATNIGSTEMPAPSSSIQGDAEFTIVGNTCASTLAAHQSCVVSVQFMPTADASPTATLNIGSQQLTVIGQGEINSAVQVLPLGLAFPATIVGIPSTLPIKLTNTTSSSVAITAITSSAPDFTESNDCGGQVTASSFCTIQVSFSPTTFNQETAALTVTFSGVATQVIEVSGQGAPPLQITPASLDFGSIEVGNSSTQNLSIGNGTGAPPQGYSVSISANFSITPNNPCPDPMPRFTGCGLPIVFQPTQDGPVTGALTISYPGIVPVSTIPLTGVGVGVLPFSLAPASLDFGSATILGGFSGSQTISINNLSQVLQSYSLALAGDFAITQNQCQDPLPPSSSCTIAVSFQPKTSGTQQGSLTISYPALTGKSVVALTGATAAFSMQVAPGESSTATISRGATAAFSIAVTPSQGFTGTVQFVCSGAPQEASCSVQPNSVNFAAVTSAIINVSLTTNVSTSAAPAPTLLIFPVAMLCFLALLDTWLRYPKVFRTVLLGFALAAAGCGGGSSQTGGGAPQVPSPSANQTPPGTYTLVVTGSGGTSTVTMPLTVKIQ
jgi:Cep192 domain 4/Beta-propeller repeat